jgi:hypothetical protein
LLVNQVVRRYRPRGQRRAQDCHFDYAAADG